MLHRPLLEPIAKLAAAHAFDLYKRDATFKFICLTRLSVRVLFSLMTDLTPASEEDVTFAIRMSISLDYRGKPRRVNAKMTGAEMDALAQKITEQLKRSNMWPHRGPGAPAHQAPDYSVAWRGNADLDEGA